MGEDETIILTDEDRDKILSDEEDQTTEYENDDDEEG